MNRMLIALSLVGLASVAHAAPPSAAAPLKKLSINEGHIEGRAVREWVIKNPKLAKQIAKRDERASTWDQLGPSWVTAAKASQVGMLPVVKAYGKFTQARSQAAYQKNRPLEEARANDIRHALAEQGRSPYSPDEDGFRRDVDRTAASFVKELPALQKAAAARGVDLTKLAPHEVARVVEASIKIDDKVSFPPGALERALAK